MSGFMQEAESLEKDFSNQSGDQTQGSNDQSSNDQSSSSSSGGGLLQDAETGGKDVMIDQGKQDMYIFSTTCTLADVLPCRGQQLYEQRRNSIWRRRSD